MSCEVSECKPLPVTPVSQDLGPKRSEQHRGVGSLRGPIAARVHVHASECGGSSRGSCGSRGCRLSRRALGSIALGFAPFWPGRHSEIRRCGAWQGRSAASRNGRRAGRYVRESLVVFEVGTCGLERGGRRAICSQTAGGERVQTSNERSRSPPLKRNPKPKALVS